jgi:hypothetical protein
MIPLGKSEMVLHISEFWRSSAACKTSAEFAELFGASEIRSPAILERYARR